MQDFTYGLLRHGDLCLDSLGRQSMHPPELRPCDPKKAGVGGNQVYIHTVSCYCGVLYGVITGLGPH